MNELGSTAEARGARPDAVGEPYPGTAAEKARTHSETRRQTARAGPAEGAIVKGGETVPVTGTATEFQGHHASPVTLSNNRRGGSPR